MSEEHEQEEERDVAPQPSQPGRFRKPPSKRSHNDKYNALLTEELEMAAFKKQNLRLEQEKLKLEIKLLKKKLDESSTDLIDPEAN